MLLSKSKCISVSNLISTFDFRGMPKESILYLYIAIQYQGFPGGSGRKESARSAGDLSFVPGLRRSPGEVNSNLPSILAWSTVHRVAELDPTEGTSAITFIHYQALNHLYFSYIAL